MLSNEGQFVQLKQGAFLHMAHLGCHEEDPCSRMQLAWMTKHIHLNQQAKEVGQWQAILFNDHNLTIVVF
jgi:hypothetical protein